MSRRRAAICSSETCLVSPSLHRSPTVPHDWSTRVMTGVASCPPSALERMFERGDRWMSSRFSAPMRAISSAMVWSRESCVSRSSLKM